jgi:hypothetical protein
MRQERTCEPWCCFSRNQASEHGIHTERRHHSKGCAEPQRGSAKLKFQAALARRERRAQRPATLAVILSMIWSIVKLAAFCRGGKSWNVARNAATIAWAPMIMYALDMYQSQ